MPPTIWDRAELLAWLAGEMVPSRGDDRTTLPVGKMKVSWAGEAPELGELPLRFVVPAADEVDFLAWASTYLGGFRPLTGLARVLTPEEELEFTLPDRRPSLGQLDAAWVGGILGEVLESAGDPSGRSLSVRACSSAFMFAVARASAVWGVPRLTELSGRRWTRCRLIVRGGNLHSPLSLVREEAARALETLSGDAPILGAFAGLLDASRRGLSSSALEHALRQHELPMIEIGDAFLGPREIRMVALEALIRQLQLARHIDIVERSLLLAVAIAAVGPGSLDYLNLATSLSSEFPGVVMWYGVCAGLVGRTAVLGEFDGFGRKVLKELLFDERDTERPRCDISLPELEVLLGAHRMPRGWRAAHPGSMVVELLPTVCTTLRWPPQPDDFSSVRAETTLANERGGQLGLDLEGGGGGSKAVRKRKDRRSQSKG